MTNNPETIWYTRCPVPTPLGIAINLGWIDQAFAADGITVNSLQEGRNPAERASHIDHSLAHSIRQGGSVPAIWARAAGADTRVIGLTWTDESQAIITLPGSGIRSVRDLRGRRIALPKRSGEKIDIFRATALRATLAALSLEGVGEQEVAWVDVDAAGREEPATDERAPVPAGWGWGARSLYTAELLALIRGEVDAIHVKGSLGHETAFLAGAQIVADTGFHPDPKIRINNGAPRPLTIDAATLEQYPHVAERLLAQVVAAGAWAESHPVEALAYLSRETGSAEQWVRIAYGGDTLHQRLHTDLSQASIDALADFTNFLFERGFLPRNFDVRAWIDPRPLEAVEAGRLWTTDKRHVA